MVQRERWLYATLAGVITASVFYGFTRYYLTFDGLPEDVPFSVHVHGLSFLLWYVLLVLQAGFVLLARINAHRKLGIAASILALLMVASGMLVIAVKMAEGLEGHPFWSDRALMIFSSLLLFVGFFSAALWYRKKAGLHRRLILAAAAVGTGAAQFRTINYLFESVPDKQAVAIFATDIFIIAAMLGDRILLGRWYKVHFWTLAIAILMQLSFMQLAGMELGIAIQEWIVTTMRPFMVLY